MKRPFLLNGNVVVARKRKLQKNMRPLEIKYLLDLKKLREEVDQISEWSMVSSYSGRDTTGWESFHLRNYSGNSLTDEISHPVASDTSDAWKFKTCLDVAEGLPGVTERVRLSKLYPNTIIPRHKDFLVTPTTIKRTVRFHIPIYNDFGSIFIVWGPSGNLFEICSEPGTIWYLPSELDHMCVNGSTSLRVNLIIDKYYSPEMKEFIQTLMP